MMIPISAILRRPRTRTGAGAVLCVRLGGRRRLAAEAPAVDGEKDSEHQQRNDHRLQPEVLRGPEKSDAAQKADEQRRIAKRRQRAANVGDQEDEKDHDVRIVLAGGVGADQRPDQNHRGAGGADDAGDCRSECEDAGIGARRAAEIARDQDTAGDDVEREQQDDEAQILAEGGVHERGQCRRHAECRGERQQCQRGPGESDLAIMVMPDAGKQQRSGRDRQQNAEERQRPRPAHGGAVERGGGQRRLRRQHASRK